MKPVGESFGFATLITVFLPGLTLSIGVILFFKGNESWLREYLKPLLELFRDFKQWDEWQQIFAALAVVSLLGSIVAAVNGLIEAWIYDRITPFCIGITKSEFDSHWNEYLFRLGKESNAYVDRIVTWFLFESRMAVVVVAIFALYLVGAPHRESWVCWMLGGALSMFSLLGMHHHKELGEYRACWSKHWNAIRDFELSAARRTARATAR